MTAPSLTGTRHPCQLIQSLDRPFVLDSSSRAAPPPSPASWMPSSTSRWRAIPKVGYRLRRALVVECGRRQPRRQGRPGHRGELGPGRGDLRGVGSSRRARAHAGSRPRAGRGGTRADRVAPRLRRTARASAMRPRGPGGGSSASPGASPPSSRDSTCWSTTPGLLPAERQRTDDGVELAFATNVLGPFVLTGLLVGALRLGDRARVINVSSGGMYTARLDVDDPQLDGREFDGPSFYAHTKRAEVVLTEVWAERLAELGISSPFDASGLGRHARSEQLAPPLLQVDATAASRLPRGRRHDRLAGDRRPRRDRPALGRVLA